MEIRKKLFFFFLFFSSIFSLFGRELTIESDFDQLLGKETNAWNYIETKEDFSQLEKYKNLYEKNKSLQFQEQKEYKIPKIIHFIWVGPKNFPTQSIENIRTWIAQHPGWKVKFWTDRERPAPCKEMEKIILKDYPFTKLKSIYEEAINWSQKADILRFEILLEEGGIYADHDANALCSFEKLNQSYDFYGCLETPRKKISGFSLMVGIGLVGVKPHHPAIEQTIKIIQRNWKEVKEKYPQKDKFHEMSRVMHGTYISLTKALEKGLEKQGNIDIVFPASYFFAQEGLPSFYSQHFFANTWVEGIRKTDYQNAVEHKLSSLSKIIRQTRVGQMLFFFLALIFFFLFLYKIYKWKKA